MDQNKEMLSDYMCQNCNEKFTDGELLKNHINCSNFNLSTTANHKIEACLKTGNIKRDSKWICETCGKAFRGSKALKEHHVVHTGAREFLCTVCSKRFGTAANLRIHVMTHSEQRPFTCQTCGAAFRQKDSLKVHVRKHTGERPFICSICKVAFDRSYTLKNHMLTHGEKSFVCSVCGKAFSTRGSLGNHERLHFKNPTQKKERQPRAKSGTGNWICDECGKIYSTPSNLKLHKKSHEPGQPCYICPVCSQSYKSRDSMEVHMRRHTEDRRFKCSTCSRSFYRSYTLKIHILTHTGEKPHKCPVNGCNKSFAQTSSLSYHVSNHKKREASSLNGNGKRPYKKRKPSHVNFLDKGETSCSATIPNIGTLGDSGRGVTQNLKLSIGAVMHQNIEENIDVDPSVQSMLDDFSSNIVHHMAHTMPSVWESESEGILGVDHSFSNVLPHSSTSSQSVVIGLQQQHCQQTPFIPYVQPDALPLLVNIPDDELYHQDNVHKVLLDQPILVPQLP